VRAGWPCVDEYCGVCTGCVWGMCVCETMEFMSFLSRSQKRARYLIQSLLMYTSQLFEVKHLGALSGACLLGLSDSVFSRVIMP
jgi:hypothetical protein